MYHLYLDESGETGIDYQNRDQPYFCISGIIIKEEQLSHIKTNMQLLKEIIGLSNDKEIHAADIKYKRLSLLYENLWPIIENNGIGIVNTGFNKVELDTLFAFDGEMLIPFSESMTKIIPYIYGSYKTILKYTHFLKDKKSSGRIFFDDRKEHEQVKEIFTKFANKELLGDSILWDIISIEFPVSNQSLLIQLADVLAYAINKANKLQIYHQERLSPREAMIINAYSVIQKYIIPDSEFDFGAILPPVLENEIFKQIKNQLLK